MAESPDVSSSTTNLPKRAASKICLVCGDKVSLKTRFCKIMPTRVQAIGFNFGVVTCESCKAFFRRNALTSTAVLDCPYDRRCLVTKTSRRHCQRCRLRKCFEVRTRVCDALTTRPCGRTDRWA